MHRMGEDGVVNDPEVHYAIMCDERVQDYMVSHRVWPTFSSYGPHFHQFYEILIHRRNGGRYSVGRDVCQMEPYHFYLAAPYQVHDMLLSDGEPLANYERICIYITEALLDKIGMQLLPINKLLGGAVNARCFHFQLRVEEYEEIFALSQRMHRTLFQPCDNAFDELEDMSCLMRIMAVLCRVIARELSEEALPSAQPLTQQISTYINRHYAEALTLDSIAQHFNVSKFTLSHEFSKALGTSVYQYLLVCRITAARQMILAGEAITNVAYRCGFNDYSSFLRAFQKVMGVTPRDFRARMEKT